MRTFRTLAALLAVLALSACGTPAANGSASSAGASAQRDPLPADPAEDSLSVGDAYELYREVTVSNGRVLTLIAHGERQDEACFGISSIDVMDGDALVQTVSLHDGIVAGNAYEDFEDPLAADATRTFDLTSGLDTQDYNFDGFPDLAITEFWGTRYAPAADGQLQAVQQTQETFLSETETQSVTYALIDGEWVLVEDSN